MELSKSSSLCTDHGFDKRRYEGYQTYNTCTKSCQGPSGILCYQQLLESVMMLAAVTFPQCSRSKSEPRIRGGVGPQHKQLTLSVAMNSKVRGDREGSCKTCYKPPQIEGMQDVLHRSQDTSPIDQSTVHVTMNMNMWLSGAFSSSEHEIEQSSQNNIDTAFLPINLSYSNQTWILLNCPKM